tara:strand:+ start:587 stop:850 length:264 start_codon:yes stop_codon:yes gene_type:complete
MWSTIISAASTVMGSKSSNNSAPSAAEQMAAAKTAYNFKPYMADLEAPAAAVKVGGIAQGSSYAELLSAWDNFLTNDYLEMSKNMKG